MKKYFLILLLLPCWCWGQGSYKIPRSTKRYAKTILKVVEKYSLGVDPFVLFAPSDTVPDLILESKGGGSTSGKIFFGEAGIIEDTIPNLTGTNEFYDEPTYATPPPYTIAGSTLKRLIKEGKIDTTPIEEIYKRIAHSQGWDTVPIRLTQPEPARPIVRNGIYVDTGFAWLPKDDTVKVIMQVSDTSKIIHFKNPTYVDNMGFEHPDTIHEDFDRTIFYITGFKVSSYTKDTYYLNERKERLSKNIIVWQSKEL